jgi:TPP-dependent pyruvate/acetoin dehydrogenase alpha subunit
MRRQDMRVCTYRGHNHTLLRGASIESLMGELFGREIGCCAGKGGSMHLTDVEHYAMRWYAIVGIHLPVPAGAAWAAVERGK